MANLRDYEYLKVVDRTANKPLLAAAYRRHLTHDEALEVVEAISGPWPVPVVVFRGKKTSCYTLSNPLEPAGRMQFCSSKPGLVRLGTVLHELAHHVQFSSNKEMAKMTLAERRRWWHGPEFVAILDGLVADFYA